MNENDRQALIDSASASAARLRDDLTSDARDLASHGADHAALNAALHRAIECAQNVARHLGPAERNCGSEHE